MSGGGGPVFIGGLDQSGKTPMRRILDASTGIAFSRRTYLWTLFDARFGDLEDDRALARCLEALRGHATLRELGVDLEAIERGLRSGERSYERLFELIGSSIATSAGRPRWGMQEAGVEGRADDILERFSAARIIHMVRDPRRRHGAVRDRRGRGVGALGASVADWLANARAGIGNVARHPERYRIVRYEDLVAAPEETGRAIAAFIEEGDAEAIARAARAWVVEARPDRDASAPTTARGIDACAARFVEAMAGPEMDALGYARSAARLSPIDRVRYGVATWPINRARAALTRATGSRRAAVARMGKVQTNEA